MRRVLLLQSFPYLRLQSKGRRVIILFISYKVHMSKLTDIKDIGIELVLVVVFSHKVYYFIGGLY